MNNSNQKYILLFLAILIIISVVVFFIFYKKDEEESSPSPSPSPSNNGNSPSPSKEDKIAVKITDDGVYVPDLPTKENYTQNEMPCDDEFNKDDMSPAPISDTVKEWCEDLGIPINKNACDRPIGFPTGWILMRCARHSFRDKNMRPTLLL